MAESFTIALTLTLEGYESAIAPKKLVQQNINGGASFPYGVFSLLQTLGTGNFGRFFCLKFYIL